MLEVKKFSATWCGPCKMLAPVMNEIKAQYPTVSFKDLDVDTYTNEAEKYNVRSVPTVILIKDGIEIQRFSGVQSKMTYKNAINENLR